MTVPVQEVSGSRYFTPTSTHRHLGLYCLGAGFREGQTAPMENRALDCYAAVLVTSGNGLLSWRGASRIRIAGPTLFWLFPGLTHTYTPSKRGWSERWVLFDGLSLRSYESLGYLNRSSAARALDGSSTVVALFEDILAAAAQTGPRAEAELPSLIHRLIVEGGRPAPSERRTRSESLVARLTAEACSPLSVEGHARRLGVSVHDLRQAVQTAGGVNPKELILQTRLAQAMTLLAETNLAVQDVAREVGYGDPAYFTRLFTRRVGSSPRQFRHQQLRRTRKLA